MRGACARSERGVLVVVPGAVSSGCQLTGDFYADVFFRKGSGQQPSDGPAMPSVAVVDALIPNAQPSSVEVDVTSTCEDLRALILSLPVPSAQSALATAGGNLCICHDGNLLNDDAQTLASAGVFAAPIVVIIAPSSARRPPRRAASPSSMAPDLSNGNHVSAAAVATASATAAAAAAASTCGSAAASACSATGAACSASAAESTGDAAPDLDDGPPADAVCRICFGSAFENGAGRLISPCMCIGSMRYVHVCCLNDWRQESANPRSFYQCDQCGVRASPRRHLMPLSRAAGCL